MKLKKHKNRRPWFYSVGELVKISSYWSQGIYASNIVNNEQSAENSTLLMSGTIGIVIDKVEHKENQFLLVLLDEKIFSFAVNKTSNSGGYWRSSSMVEYALERIK